MIGIGPNLIYRSRIIRGTALFATGVAISVTVIGRPEWSGQNAASWASATGTILAAIVALGLGLHSASESARSRARRAAAASILVSTNLYRLRSLVDTIAECKEVVLKDSFRYAAWLAKLSNGVRKFDDVIDDRTTAFLADIPTDELSLLVGAHEAFRSFRRRSLLPEVVTIEQIILSFDAFIADAVEMTPIVVCASDAIHRLSGLSGPPPWGQTLAGIEAASAG